MAYTINIKPSAQKDLDALPDKEAFKILSRIAQLESDPRPIGIQKLHHKEGYRIRSGNYRILYEIDDKKESILIYRIKHRKEVYR
ncbi:MAG: type II toxin-antitoxin system RelE/ParE family toxin [Bacteroidota bacterium]|nr:type II toxin-antitoxin system RelE/ParE family toxin [Bacteroidota bacterium]